MFMPLCACAEGFFKEDPSFLPLDSPAKPLHASVHEEICIQC